MGTHLIFDGGVIPRADLEARVVPQEAELDDWALIEESELEILSPWGAERVRHALAVLRGEEQPDLYTTPERR